MKRATRNAIVAATAAGGFVVCRPGSPAHRIARHRIDAVTRRLRYFGGLLDGIAYTLAGQHPDPDAIDLLLADRIRSSIGPIVKELDVPHILVMVEGHVALLHGEVGSHADAAAIEAAVARVFGVLGVESYLHVGLTPGDTRPSSANLHFQPSGALRKLTDAVTRGGVREGVARPVLRAILATFADRLPAGERNHVAAHLPADVRPLFFPPRRTAHAKPARTVRELVARINSSTTDLPPDAADSVTAAVLGVLRSIVPEEARDVSAVLPAELRDFWDHARPPTEAVVSASALDRSQHRINQGVSP